MKETFHLAACLLQVKLAQGSVSQQVKVKVQGTSCPGWKECEVWRDRHPLGTSLTLMLACAGSEVHLDTWAELLLRVENWE